MGTRLSVELYEKPESTILRTTRSPSRSLSPIQARLQEMVALVALDLRSWPFAINCYCCGT